MGLTDLIEHEIDTGQERPVRQSLRKTPMVHNEVIDTHVQSMLKQGIIEPSHGAWSSNVVLVQKKDKSYRFCVDYRKTNEITRKDTFPIPRIDASLDALAGASWFTTLDLRSGYFQVPLSRKDAHKTAFITRSGSFQFRVLPMGLCNSASTFQRLMNMVLAGLTYTSCLVYLDDIIIMSRSLDEHLSRLREVFSRIRSAHLKLRPDKCVVLQKEVTFLGHVVSANGIAMDEKKLAAVRDWETPRCVKDVRAYVGFCSYYRRYLKDFSALCRPLHALTRKNVRFEWTPECQESFDELKRRLTSAPVVSLPRDEGEYRLDTDASGWSIGAVLSQVQDGQERVLSYASRLYSKAESHYCTTRRELLAIVYFTRYFKQYLLGRKFVIRTDHAALQWLRRTPDPVGQQARWLEQLSAYDFDIIHRPGVQHGNADGLSRIPCRQCGRDDEDSAPGIVAPVTEEDVDRWSPESMQVLQKEDPEIVEFCDLLKQFPDRKPTWSELDGSSEFVKILWTMWTEFKMVEGVLYRESVGVVSGLPELRLVVPWAQRNEFIRLVHEGMTGGHVGITRTREQVRRRAYWPGWTKSVELFVKACRPCARYQNGKAPKQGLLRPMIASKPFETLGVDVTGPHTKSSNGFIYILTVVDHYSKFAFAFPMRNQEAATIAKLLVDGVICLVGTPTRILTDQGPNFESALIRELCRNWGIVKVRTSPYEASTNGGTERFHRTLNSMLAKVVKENQRNWDSCLQPVLAAYRASRHTATSLTPNMIIFGRENVMPADLVLCNPTSLPESENSVVDFVANQQTRFRTAYQIVRDHLKVAAMRRKSYYDTSVRARHFTVGSRVWYFYPRKYIKRSKKWSFVYVGPYKILRKVSDVTYEIQKSPRDKPLIVHVDKLKLCAGMETVNVPAHTNNCSVFSVFQMNRSAKPDKRRTERRNLTRSERKRLTPGYQDRPWVCIECDDRFTKHCDLVRHEQARHMEVRYVCHLCMSKFTTRSSLKRHQESFHKDECAQERIARRVTATESSDSVVRIQENPRLGTALVRQVTSDEEPVGNNSRDSPRLRVTASVPERDDEDEDAPLVLMSFDAGDQYEVCGERRRERLEEPLPVRLQDFVPTAEEQQLLEGRLAFWSRRLEAVKERINEEEWVAKFQEEERRLGCVGRHAFVALVRMHRAMWKERARLLRLVPPVERKSMSRRCTDIPRSVALKRERSRPSATVSVPPGEAELSAQACESPKEVPDERSSDVDKATPSVVETEECISMRFCALAKIPSSPGDPFLSTSATSLELSKMETVTVEKETPIVTDEFSFDEAEIFAVCCFDA